jgi:hypothetical protein
VRQDRPFTLSQRRAGLEPEFVHQAGADIAIALKRVGLTPGAVEGQHQLRGECLVERMRAQQRLQLAGDPEVVSERQVGVDPLSKRGKPQILQASGL